MYKEFKEEPGTMLNILDRVSQNILEDDFLKLSKKALGELLF